MILSFLCLIFCRLLVFRFLFTMNLHPSQLSIYFVSKINKINQTNLLYGRTHSNLLCIYYVLCMYLCIYLGKFWIQYHSLLLNLITLIQFFVSSFIISTKTCMFFRWEINPTYIWLLELGVEKLKYFLFSYFDTFIVYTWDQILRHL